MRPPLSVVRRTHGTYIMVSLVSFLLMPSHSATAQELEPRSYSASPIGVNFLAISIARSTGGVVVDPALPVEDVEAKVGSLGVGAGRTLNLFGRTALVVAAVPYVRATATGSVGEDRRSVSRSGFADARFKMSMNFLGGRPLTPREFAAASPKTIIGASITVVPPLGQYDRTKLVNLGSNRWSFKPEAGISRTVGRWTLEGYTGVWLFTDNEEYYTGDSIRTQSPIASLQAHVGYTMRPRLWTAFDATWYSGGTTSVDGVEKGDLKRNSRIGATLSLPLPRQQSLKVAASTGATTRIGADFKTIGVAWQLTWFD